MGTLNDTVDKQPVWLKLASARLTLPGFADAIFFNEHLQASFALALSFTYTHP